MIPRKILIATTNSGKLAELSAMLDADVWWLNLNDFPDVPEVPEDGQTFAENAGKKAMHYAKATGLWTIADDSGLCVDALNGAPGVKSARFSGEKTPNRGLLDYKNIAKLLDLLSNIPQEKRTARFVCSLALASPEKILLQTEGTLEGIIAFEPSGRNGFGYDPVFFVPELGKTVAQLSIKQKNAISHRSNAIKKLKLLLDELIST